jgi:hypothetical protein
MSDVAQIDLERLAREAADEIAGADSVHDAKVESGLDSQDQPAYRFVFVIDRSKVVGYQPGERRIALGIKIRDRLLAKGDETYPYLSIISPEEWRARSRA